MPSAADKNIYYNGSKIQYIIDEMLLFVEEERRKDEYMYLTNVFSLYEWTGLEEGLRSTVENGPKKNRMIELFLKMGWSKKYVENKLGGFSDTDFDKFKIDWKMDRRNWRQTERAEEKLVSAIFGFWLRDFGGFKDTIYDSLVGLGICETVAEHVADVLEPLEDTCYTDDQMLILAIDYMMGNADNLREIADETKISRSK
jgi:hypothetical protein